MKVTYESLITSLLSPYFVLFFQSLLLLFLIPRHLPAHKSSLRHRARCSTAVFIHKTYSLFAIDYKAYVAERDPRMGEPRSQERMKKKYKLATHSGL